MTQFLFEVARQGIHSGLVSPGDITYRQHVLADCIAQPGVIRDLYDVAVAAITAERQVLAWIFRDSPDTLVHRTRQVMQIYVDVFRRLRGIADAHAADFRSDGFARFFAMIVAELDDDYFAEMEAHLSELAFRRGTLISAGLGKGLKGTGYVLRRHPEQTWRDRVPGMNRSGYSFVIAERDDAGHAGPVGAEQPGPQHDGERAGPVGRPHQGLLQDAPRRARFLPRLPEPEGPADGQGRAGLLPRPGQPRRQSRRGSAGRASLSARGLYDACLSLSTDARAVGNDVDADGRQLVMITGANQGGKSTFLRSVGLAQLMMQAGMFVAAESFTASVSAGIFTHFKREEDAAMEKGKLDEELARMSAITSQIRPGCLLLYNESFASTNEREGSEIARQVIRALTESGVRIVFVTHMYDLAGRYYAEQDPGTLFLRAERRDDGQRTFRLLPGEPLPTSYGEDLYREVFGG